MSKLSFRPSNFVEGGGLIDDIDVTVKEATFMLYDYDGTIQQAVPALAVVLTAADGSEHNNYWSAGDTKFFQPSKDDINPAPASDASGPYLIPVGDKTGLNNNTNIAKFFESMVNAGWPEDKLDGFKATDLIGLQFHLKREAVKRSGLVRTGKNAGREQTVATVGRIIKLPWEAAPKSSTGLTAAKPAAAGSSSTPKTNGSAGPVSSASPDLAKKAAETVMGILLENDGRVPKGKLATLTFAALKGDPDQKAVSGLVLKDEFLRGTEGIAYDGAVVSMAG